MSNTPRAFPKDMIKAIHDYTKILETHRQEIENLYYDKNLPDEEKYEQIVAYAEEHHLIDAYYENDETFMSITEMFKFIQNRVNKAYVEKHSPGYIRVLQALGLIENKDIHTHYEKVKTEIRNDLREY